MKLPVVNGSNLLREKKQLPRDLGGKINLLFVPFQQWQQLEVNSWAPLAAELEQAHPDFRFYELPTIQSRNVVSKAIINEGMRAGIPDHATRARTITLYIDKQPFRDALAMPDESHVYLLLTDELGNILWRSRGAYDPETAESLIKAVRECLPEYALA